VPDYPGPYFILSWRFLLLRPTPFPQLYRTAARSAWWSALRTSDRPY